VTKSGPRSWKTDLPLILGVLLLCPCISLVLLGVVGPWEGPRKPRALQSECLTNLKSLYTEQKTRQRGYVTQLRELAPPIERGNRYAYFIGPGPVQDRSGELPVGTGEAQGVGVDTWKHQDLTPITFEQLPVEVARRVGISGQCPECEITMVCAGNIDQDSTLDIWSISTLERTGPDGQRYAPGDPMHHLNDVER